MIWKYEFTRINFAVERAVKEIYQKIESSTDYVPFLAFGEYIEENEKTEMGPYEIGNRTDGFKDDAWLRVLMTFLNSSYSFSNENTSDSKESIFFETMLYIHIWESRPYLRFLKRIANLLSADEYLWKPKIKDRTKSVFLEQHILPDLKRKNLKIVEIIEKGYNKQIRDAIAHNEYWHNLTRPELIFENYKSNPDRIDKLHYNKWTEIFVHTFLLAYHLRSYFEQQKKNLDDNKCKTGFEVKLIDKGNSSIDGLIFFDKENNKFTGKLKKSNANKKYLI